MSNEIQAKKIFQRSYFKSYAEFYLALALGNILNDRGYALNMDGMQVDADAIPSDMIKFQKRLLNDGAITLSLYEKGVGCLVEEAFSDVVVDYFKEIPLYEDRGDILYWDFEYARENYGEYAKEFLNFKKMGYSLVHLVANHLVDVLFGKTKKKLVIYFDSQKAKSSFIYIKIYACLESMPWIKEYVDLRVDLDDYKVDLDYSFFCNNGKVAGHHRLHSIEEKHKLLDKFGMVEGSILILANREGMCENNPFGYIKSTTVMRLDEIGDSFLGVTCISINKTKEEVELDFYDIDDNVRYMFVDMLSKKPHQSSTELNIVGVGIDNHFLDEDKFITLLDDSEEVTKLVTIDGKQVNVNMSGIDAVYWILRQYEIDFDIDLFKKMYFKDKTPLWDTYNKE